MIHIRGKSFISLYNSLPKDAQKLADKAFKDLVANPRNISVNFKPVKSVNGVYAANVGNFYRATARLIKPGVFGWYWIGSHNEYNKKY